MFNKYYQEMAKLYKQNDFIKIIIQYKQNMLLLIRHGQCVGNTLPLKQRAQHPDTKLTNLGVLECKLMANHVIIGKNTTCWSSPLVRAKATMDYLSTDYKIVPEAAEYIHDSCWETFNKQIQSLYNKIQDWSKNNKDSQDTLVIVCHGGVMITLFHKLWHGSTSVLKKGHRMNLVLRNTARISFKRVKKKWRCTGIY